MKKTNYSKALQNLALISHIGINMLVTVGGGILLGGFIDRKVGTKSVFLAIFTVLAVLAAFMNLYKVATQGYKREGK